MGDGAEKGVNSEEVSFWFNVGGGDKGVGGDEVVWFSEHVWGKKVKSDEKRKGKKDAKNVFYSVVRVEGDAGGITINSKGV